MTDLLRKYGIPLALGALALFPSCAKDNSPSTGEVSRQYLELWMAEYHPGVTPKQENGIYILSDEPGTGAAWDKSKAYTQARVTIRTLTGTITSTDDERLAQQLGTWAQGNYYGPGVYATGEGYMPAGVDAMLEDMRMGGTRTAVIPAWLTTTYRYATMQDYIDAATSSTHYIYTITPVCQIEDPVRWEKDSLTTYVKRHYGAQVKSRAVGEDIPADSSFYFVSDTTAFIGLEKLASGASVKLNYTGRLLNGQIFDTTDERTAKDAGIYNPSRTYEPASVTLASEYGDITMGGSNKLVNGFKAGLFSMHWKGQKAVVLFTSPLGYSTSGQGDAIPGYAPLLFELEFTED